MNQTVSPILLLQKQRALLQMEYDAEKEEFRRQTETLGVRRKVKRGDCWLPLRIGRSYYNSLNQLVVEVFRTADTDVEHNFEFGRQVMFFHIDANDEIRYFSFSATVSYAEAERMVVAIPDAGCVAQLQGANQVGVQLSFDETTYRLMMDALERVMRAKGNRLAHLRDIFYNPSKTEKFTFAPMRFPWLNPTQEHAVNEVLLAKDVAMLTLVAPCAENCVCFLGMGFSCFAIFVFCSLSDEITWALVPIGALTSKKSVRNNMIFSVFIFVCFRKVNSIYFIILPILRYLVKFAY